MQRNKCHLCLSIYQLLCLSWFCKWPFIFYRGLSGFVTFHLGYQPNLVTVSFSNLQSLSCLSNYQTPAHSPRRFTETWGNVKLWDEQAENYLGSWITQWQYQQVASNVAWRRERQFFWGKESHCGDRRRSVSITDSFKSSVVGSPPRRRLFVWTSVARGHSATRPVLMRDPTPKPCRRHARAFWEAPSLGTPTMTCNTSPLSRLIRARVRVQFHTHVSRLGGEGVNL